MKRKILYIGNFELPDKNAAAQRVLSIAKGLRTLGHEVFFLNYSKEATTAEWKNYFGFSCYEMPKRSLYKSLTSIDDVMYVVQKEGITDIFTYNYPAYTLWKILALCRKKGIRCFADVTEWYVPCGNIVYRIVKTIDSEWRMRVLHKKTNGVIAISKYLYQYYCADVNTVKIPPTVDIREKKWEADVKKRETTVFVYAGSPSKQKERLDLIIDAIEKSSKNQPVALRVIGITKAQYEKMYGKQYAGIAVTFAGRISHLEAIREIKQADWSIIIRDDNKVVQAGFPTKVVESIACGTPVIANRFSNIADYLNEENSILCEPDEIEEAVLMACGTKKKVDPAIFDYHSYLKELDVLHDQGEK